MDIEQNKTQAGERVLRLRLGWILVGALIMIGLGIVGGMAAQWWADTPLGALPEAQDRLVTTIQEVTISPSTATAQVVEKNGRSVVLLARKETPQILLGSGVIVTSDGLIATTATLPEGALIATTSESGALEVERVGVDVLFGMTYLRLRSGVFVPTDVRDSDVPVGFTMTALSRAPITGSARVRSYTVQEYQLPPSAAPFGWQRLYAGDALGEAILPGSPLFDDEGRLAGLVLPPSTGISLPSTALRQSLARVVDRKFESSIFEQLGMNVAYVFEKIGDGQSQFRVVVTAVQPNAPAAQTGVKSGDRIEKIQGEAVAWDKSVVEAFGQRETVALQVRRGEEMLAITITPSAETP